MSEQEKRAASSFYEQECKLTAQSARQLKNVRRHIIDDPHYVTLNDARFLPEAFQGIKLLGVPESRTPPRMRVYYDDAWLSGFRNGVEIRIEYKPQSTSDKSPYKQVVKIGNNTAAGDGMFDRLEYSARLSSPKPDLNIVKNGERRRLKEIFEVSDLSSIKLLPLIQIVSQRWRLEFHPDGDPKTRIEYAHDIGIGQTFTGYQWKLFESELELKKGNPRALVKEKKRLMEAFNFFVPAQRSKPSAGFDVVSAALSEKSIRKIVQRELTPGAFSILKI